MDVPLSCWNVWRQARRSLAWHGPRGLGWPAAGPRGTQRDFLEARTEAEVRAGRGGAGRSLAWRSAVRQFRTHVSAPLIAVPSLG